MNLSLILLLQRTDLPDLDSRRVHAGFHLPTPETRLTHITDTRTQHASLVCVYTENSQFLHLILSKPCRS